MTSNIDVTQIENPVRVVLFGASGRMGGAVAKRLETDQHARYAGSVRRSNTDNGALEGLDASQQVQDVQTLLADAHAAIDFTLPEGVHTHVALCARFGVPYVCGVTALSDDTLKELQSFATDLPVLWAPNMSTGVTVCFGAAADIASRLGAGFSVSITDIHHAGKQDAPSGTALEFGRVIRDAAKKDVDIAYESVREGTHPGEHHLVFRSGSDVIELRHRAGTRDEFAAGAVRAAQWLATQTPGFYNMRNVLGITGSA